MSDGDLVARMRCLAEHDRAGTVELLASTVDATLLRLALDAATRSRASAGTRNLPAAE